MTYKEEVELKSPMVDVSMSISGKEARVKISRVILQILWVFLWIVIPVLYVFHLPELLSYETTALIGIAYLLFLED